MKNESLVRAVVSRLTSAVAVVSSDVSASHVDTTARLILLSCVAPIIASDLQHQTSVSSQYTLIPDRGVKL